MGEEPVSYFFLKGLSAFISLFPLKFLYSAAGFFTKTIFFLWKTKRENVRSNYELILTKKFGRAPTETEIKKVMADNFENYGKFNAEFLYIGKLVRANMLPPISNPANVDKALSYGRGLIMGTLHFTNWDIAGISIAGHYRNKNEVWAIADDLGGGYSKFVQESRKTYGINIVLPNKNLKDAYKCLQRNSILNVLVDRPVNPESESATEVEFFGKKCFVATAAARLAIKTGAKITIGYMERVGSNFLGHTAPFLEYTLTGNGEKDIHTITQTLFVEAEKIIIEHPEQWYMFRNFWGSQKLRNNI